MPDGLPHGFLYRSRLRNRILLPVATFDVERKVEPPVAALDLGLSTSGARHLLTTVTSEPVKRLGVRGGSRSLRRGARGPATSTSSCGRERHSGSCRGDERLDRLLVPARPGEGRLLAAASSPTRPARQLRTSRQATTSRSILRERGRIERVEQIDDPARVASESELEARFVGAPAEPDRRPAVQLLRPW
jgi:hypothetical protein